MDDVQEDENLLIEEESKSQIFKTLDIKQREKDDCNCNNSNEDYSNIKLPISDQ